MHVHVRSIDKLGAASYRDHIILFKSQTEINAPRMTIDFD